MFCYKNGLTFDPLQSDLLKGSVQNHHGAAKCTQVAKSKYFQNHSAHTPLNANLINQWPEGHRRIKKKCLLFLLRFLSLILCVSIYLSSISPQPEGMVCWRSQTETMKAHLHSL